MSSVFYYCDREKLDKVMREGIKIEELCDKRIGYSDCGISVVTAYLSPLDNKSRKNSMQYVCLELDVDHNKCFASDKDLWDAQISNPMNYEIKRMYFKSVVPLKDYKYGQYRIAEVLIDNDVPVENIKLYSSKNRGVTLFAEEFNPYYGCLVEEIREEKGNAYITYIYCEMMVCEGLFDFVDEFSQGDGYIRIYYDRQNKRCISVLRNIEWGELKAGGF